MDIDVIWWIVAGILYLLFGLRKKKAKRQAAPRQGMSLEEALRAMAGGAADTGAHAVAPALPPMSAPVTPVATPVQPDLYPAARASDGASRKHKHAPAATVSQQEKSYADTRWSAGATLGRQLKDPQSARNAFILSTIFGQPHALRRNGPMRRV